MLWIPGPTEVRPEIRAECARPQIGHRTAAMAELHERIDPPLRRCFGLVADSGSEVAVHTASGTALMEMALRGSGPRVLSIVNGAFARRFADVAESLGREVRRVEIPWGRGITAQELARALETDGPWDALTLVANETSTGARTPLAPLAPVFAEHPETLRLVDLVSILAGAPTDFDANGIDFGLAGVQKALALPPGLGVFAVSARYRERAEAATRRSWYLDPLRILAGHRARKTPATPATGLYFALARQLEDIDSGRTLAAADRPASGAAAWAARYAKHERMRQRTLTWAAGHGLAPLPPEPFRSPTVSCLSTERPGGTPIDAAALVRGLAARGFEISGGYGELRGRTFRIGHMGDHTEEGLEALLAAADEVLAETQGTGA